MLGGNKSVLTLILLVLTFTLSSAMVFADDSKEDFYTEEEVYYEDEYYEEEYYPKEDYKEYPDEHYEEEYYQDDYYPEHEDDFNHEDHYGEEYYQDKYNDEQKHIDEYNNEYYEEDFYPQEHYNDPYYDEYQNEIYEDEYYPHDDKYPKEDYNHEYDPKDLPATNDNHQETYYDEEEMLKSEIDFIKSSNLDALEALENQLEAIEDKALTEDLTKDIDNFKDHIDKLNYVDSFEELYIINDELVQEYAQISYELNGYFMQNFNSEDPLTQGQQNLMQTGEPLEELSAEAQRLISFFENELKHLSLLLDELKDKDVDTTAINQRINEFSSSTKALEKAESFEELYDLNEKLNEEYFTLANEVNEEIFEKYNAAVEKEYLKEHFDYLLEENEFIITQLHERLDVISKDLDTKEVKQRIDKFETNSKNIENKELSWESIEELEALNSEAFSIEQELIRLEEQTIDEEILKEYIEVHKPEFQEFLDYMQQNIHDLKDQGVQTNDLQQKLDQIKNLVKNGENELNNGNIRAANEILFSEELFDLADDLIEEIEELMATAVDPNNQKEHIDEILSEGDEFLSEIDEFLKNKDGPDAKQAKEQIIFLKKTLSRMNQEYDQGNYEKVFEIFESDAVQKSVDLLEESLSKLEAQI